MIGRLLLHAGCFAAVGVLTGALSRAADSGLLAVVSFWCALCAITTGSAWVNAAARETRSPLLRCLERWRADLAGDEASFEQTRAAGHTGNRSP